MSSSKAPFYPVFYRDWMTDPAVMAMTLEEEGAYHRVLMFQWSSGRLPWNLSPTSAELPRLQTAMKGVDRRVAQRLWLGIRHCFVEVDGACYNQRLERVRADVDAKRARQSLYGKRGGRPKGEPKATLQNPQSRQRQRQLTNRAHAPTKKASLSKSRPGEPVASAPPAPAPPCPTCGVPYYLAGYETPAGVTGRKRCGCPPTGPGWFTERARAFVPQLTDFVRAMAPNVVPPSAKNGSPPP